MRTQVLPDDFDPTATIVPGPVVKQPEPQQQAMDPRVQQHLTPKSMLPDQAPPEETTLAESNAAYINVADETPTGCAFYHFDKLSVRPYGLPEKFKLGAATKSGRIRYVVDAVAATVDRPIMSMALIDFWFLCYWLRTMSYKGNPLAAHWGCENPDHVRKVVLEQVAAETLQNKTVIERTAISVIPLEQELKELSLQLLEGDMKMYIHPPTVSDFLERVEFGADWDDEFSYMADIAVYLRAEVHGKKIADRVKWLQRHITHEEAEAKLDLLKQAMEMIVKCGVKETFESNCAHCQMQQQVSLEVDLLTFFPV